MKKLFKLVPIALLGFCLVFNSCSEEDAYFESSNDIVVKNMDSNPYQVLGELHVLFLAELFKDGFELYQSRMNLLLYHLQHMDKESFTIEDSAALYSNYMKVDKELSVLYFSQLSSYGSSLNGSNLDIFQMAVSNFIETGVPQSTVTKRWGRIFRYGGIFSAIATVSGAGCGTRVMAGFIDTAIAGAAAVSTGGALAPAVAGSYIALIATIIDCTMR